MNDGTEADVCIPPRRRVCRSDQWVGRKQAGEDPDLGKPALNEWSIPIQILMSFQKWVVDCSNRMTRFDARSGARPAPLRVRVFQLALFRFWSSLDRW